MNFLTYILAVLFGSVFVMRFVVASLLKWVHPDRYKVKIDYTLKPTVSVLLPCFNEGQAVYDTIKSIRHSDYPADRLEIIAIDDHSGDDSYEWMLKAEQDFPNVQVHRNSENMGKGRTMIRALGFSTAEICLSTDSDTLFATDTIKELMACFADPYIGAVGGVVGLLNVNDNFLTAYQAFQYYLGFRLYKIAENWTKTVGCLAGPLFAVRRHVLQEVAPMVEARNWCGIHVTDGEDRFLTHMIVLNGHGTYVNTKAQCWTIAPNTFSKYFNQQLRWKRSPIRDFFLTIRTLPAHLKLDSPWTVLYVYLFLPLTLFGMLFRVGVSAMTNPMFWADPPLILAYMGLAIIVSLLMKKYSPEQTISNPFRLAAFGAWWIISSLFLTTLSVFTLDSGDWGTRSTAMKQPAVAPLDQHVSVMKPTTLKEIEENVSEITV